MDYVLDAQVSLTQACFW